jgi:hypothetical protein
MSRKAAGARQRLAAEGVQGEEKAMHVKARRRSPALLLAGLLIGALLALAAGSASASASTVWLCRPGATPNPCLNSEETTVELGNGKSFVEHPKPAKNPPIDCFYVYPTVSSYLFAENAPEKVEPEEEAIAESQASRFSQVCKVYAPIYPQLTIPAITPPNKPSPGASLTAYLGVRAAFLEYLKHFNKGRGFELIGHSQGSAMLESLIKEFIDPEPALRKQLVGAEILGGQVIVPEGKTPGGTFQNVPACQHVGQIGCVTAYSSFLKEPPNPSLFGRVSSILGGGLPEVENPQVLCVNPTILAQGPYSGPAFAYYPTLNAYPGKMFPGFLGAAVQAPVASTPWVATPAQYSAQCEARGGASWLQLNLNDESDPRERIKETLGPEWGTHLVDMNALLGNLVGLVGAQSLTYQLQGGL